MTITYRSIVLGVLLLIMVVGIIAHLIPPDSRTRVIFAEGTTYYVLRPAGFSVANPIQRTVVIE